MAIATDRRAVLAAGATLAAAAATQAFAQPAGLGTGSAPSKLFRTTEIASFRTMRNSQGRSGRCGERDGSAWIAHTSAFCTALMIGTLTYSMGRLSTGRGTNRISMPADKL